MKVSVITVCYNSARTIEKTFQSLAQQTYKNYEYIVIDGLSTDGTPQLVEKYRSMITTLRSERDQGLYDALNKGIALAKGELIFFLNSDDFFASSTSMADGVHAITERCKILGLTPSDALWHGRLKVLAAAPPNFELGHPLRQGDLDVELDGLHQPAVFFPKSLFQKIEAFNIRYEIAADYDLLRRAAKLLPVHFIDVMLVEMLDGGLSSQRALRAHFENTLIAYRSGTPVLKIVKRHFRPILRLAVESHAPALAKLFRRLRQSITSPRS